jgi:hypothetical protein
LFDLVSQFENLTELVLQIPVSSSALGIILEACHLNLQKLDYHADNRAEYYYKFPSLPRLIQLAIRYDSTVSTGYDFYWDPCFTSEICFFIAVTCNLRKIVIQGATLEPGIVATLTALRGLSSLQILGHRYQKGLTTSHEFPKVFPQASELKALSMPLHFWCLFPQGYFEALQVLNLEGDYLKNSIQRNPRFTMALRSVSISVPLDLASLETLGKAHCLEHLKIDLGHPHKEILQQFAHAGVYDTHAFLKLKELTMHEYYIDYMRNFELPKVTQFELSDLVYNSDLGLSKVPEIPWNHQLLSLKVSCSSGRVAWNSQASFPKLDAMDLNFSELEGSFLCQFPALRKLRLESCGPCSTLGITPTRFPQLGTLGFYKMSGPYRIPVKHISTFAMSIEVLSSLMKYDEVDTVEFYSLYRDNREVLELFWHNTPSSIRLWKYLPSTKFSGVDSNNLHIIFLSSDLDSQVILPAVLWYMKRRLVDSKRNKKANGINYDYVKSRIRLIIKVETLKSSLALKTLVKEIRRLRFNCTIRIFSPPTERT